MSALPDPKMVVFYTWQSDLPAKVNRFLIRDALHDARDGLAKEPINLVIKIDEATRDISGSPNIVEAIFKKIRVADVFVCDLSKVCEIQNEKGEARKFCNPNAAIELGYAIRVLGWERIILVFNTAYGKVPGDLPFDAQGQLAFTYHCKADLDKGGKPTAECKQLIKKSASSLKILLSDAIKLVARNNPQRPADKEAKTPAEIKRAKDLMQLGQVFRWIHLNMLNSFINDLANQGWISYTAHHFWECLSATINSPTFHLHDKTLRKLVIAFAQAWSKCFRHLASMDIHPSGKVAYFRLPGDMWVSKAQEKEYRFTIAQPAVLRPALDELLHYVREEYPEFDLIKPAAAEREAYRETEKEDIQMMKDIWKANDEVDRGLPPSA